MPKRPSLDETPLAAPTMHMQMHAVCAPDEVLCQRWERLAQGDRA